MNTLFKFILLVLAIIRGTSFIAIKELTQDITSNQLIFYRFFFSAIILLIIFHKLFMKLKINEIVLGAIGGVFLYLAFFSQTIGIQYTTIPKQAFLTSLYILFIPIFEYVFYKKIFYKKINLIGIILGLFFIFFDDMTKLQTNFNVGDLLTLFCALFFALNIIIFKNKEDLNIFNVTIVQFVTVTFISYISSIIIDKKVISLEYKYFNKYIFFLIIFCTLINFLFQNISQRYVTPEMIGIILSLESVFGALFSKLYFKDLFSINFVLGCSIIFISLILIQRSQNLRKVE